MSLFVYYIKLACTSTSLLTPTTSSSKFPILTILILYSKYLSKIELSIFCEGTTDFEVRGHVHFMEFCETRLTLTQPYIQNATCGIRFRVRYWGLGLYYFPELIELDCGLHVWRLHWPARVPFRPPLFLPMSFCQGWVSWSRQMVNRGTVRKVLASWDGVRSLASVVSGSAELWLFKSATFGRDISPGSWSGKSQYWGHLTQGWEMHEPVVSVGHGDHQLPQVHLGLATFSANVKVCISVPARARRSIKGKASAIWGEL